MTLRPILPSAAAAAAAAAALALGLLTRPLAAQTEEQRTRGSSYHWQDENTFLPGPVPYSSPRPVVRSSTEVDPAKPAKPPEPPAAPFGARGEFVVSGDSNIGLSSTSYDSSQASRLELSFSPVVDYFFLRNLSIGLTTGAAYDDVKGYGTDGSLVETKSTSLSVGPRLGLNVPLGHSFSWWLIGAVGIEANQATQSVVSGTSASVASSSGAPSTNQVGPWVMAYAPLLVHPAPHFFLGVGPSVFHEFARVQGANAGDERTTVGVGLTVGGSFGGAPVAQESPTETSPATTSASKIARFGEAGQLFLTSELVAALHSSEYEGTPSSVLDGQLAAGAEYFFANHFSAGLHFNVGHQSASGVDASGVATENDQSSVGIGGSFGAELPLADALSLYARASLGVNTGSQSESSAAAADQYTFLETWASLYVPVVLRVAPHLVVGFGPSITRDLTESDTFTPATSSQSVQVSNPATTVGAGFLVGGWL